MDATMAARPKNEQESAPGPIHIIGGGVAGLATAYFLARMGRATATQVTLLEREEGTGRHSSGLNAAILRTAIGQATTRRLAEESAAFFKSPPPDFCDGPLVNPTGLVLFEPGCEEVLAARTACRALSAEEAAALLPHYATRGRRAFHVTDEGQLDIAALLAAYERGARAAGVTLRNKCEVAKITTRACRGSGGGAQRTPNRKVTGLELADGETLATETVVLAAGGWAGLLGGGAGSRLTLTPKRRHLMVSAPDENIDPTWPVAWSDGDGFYAKPESGGLMLSACDQSPVHPDHCTTDPAVLDQLAAKTARHLPAFADAGVASFWCAMRTFAPDEHFRIGPDPDVAGLFWVAALGGHGMTCSPAIGRLAANDVVQQAAALRQLA
jgi:D-arginine dehydrogenase